MKTLTNVKSQTKPIEVDDYTSSTTVFVRSNIKESTETDPIFNTESKVYTYDEIQYTYPEWNKIITDQIKENSESLQEQLDVVQSAIVEILKTIAPIIEVNNITEETIKEKDSSAIVQLFQQMIKNGLLTKDQVPDLYKESVSKTEE